MIHLIEIIPGHITSYTPEPVMDSECINNKIMFTIALFYSKKMQVPFYIYII